MATPDALYEALGINRGAPPEVIHKAYRKAAKACHPDAGGDAKQWALICLARDTLTDERRRKKYDETGTTDDLEAAARQTVYDAILQVVATANRMGALTEFDIVADAVTMLRQNITNIRSAQSNLRAADKVLPKIVARFRPLDGKPNLLHELLAEQFAGAQRAAQTFEMQIKVTERAIAILKDHRFDFTARDWFG